MNTILLSRAVILPTTVLLVLACKANSFQEAKSSTTGQLCIETMKQRSVVRDVELAAKHGDFRVFQGYYSGFAVGAYVPGIRKCEVRIPNRGSAQEPVASRDINGFDSASAHECRRRLDEYHRQYNVEMIRAYPVSYGQICENDRNSQVK